MALIGVFSAHAEVVPKILENLFRQNGILRARGGSSLIPQDQAIGEVYSPRTRR